MYPSGQMSGSYYDPYAGNYGSGYTMPCCGSNGYNYFYPPGPVTPYPHMYPSPHTYVAPHPVPLPYHHHHHHPHYNHPLPGTPAPANFNAPTETSLPVQQQQQQQLMWRPMVVPASSCCCGHAQANHVPYYGNPWSGGLSNDAKVSNETGLEDVKKVDGARPVLWSDGSKSSQPQLIWIPPQYLGNLQQQVADKEPQDVKGGGQLIPFDLGKLASLHNKDSNKSITADAGKEFPFPIILMPSDSDNSRKSPVKNRISEIEEKPSSCNNPEPLKLLGNGGNERLVPPELVKTSGTRNDAVSQGIQAQNEKVRVKDIPVKQGGESTEKKPSTDAAIKSQSRSVSPSKTSKLPPVCLRVDPLPRKKNGNGNPKPSSAPSHQTGRDTNSEKKEVSKAKISDHNTDNTKNVKVIEASSENIPNRNPVSPETGSVKNRRENYNEGEIMESKKSAQSETPVGTAHDVKPRESISKETAAVRIQSAYRGYEERKWHSLQKLRQISKVRDQISCIKDRVEMLGKNADMNKEEFERQRLLLGETIMSHLLTLDTIQGLHPNIRDVRKSVARELINLQEKLDLFQAQRFKERGYEMNQAADNNEVNKVPCRKTEEQGSSGMINAGDQQENEQFESDREKMNALDGSVDKSENLTENICDDPHQKETHADNALTEDTLDVTPQEGKSLLNFNAGIEDDMKLMSSPNEVEDRSKETTEGTMLEKQSFEGGDNGSVDKTASKHESTANCDIVAVDPQTVETSQTVVEGEMSDPLLCCTADEIPQAISGVVAGDGTNKQVSVSGDDPAIEVCSETSEHVCNHVEKQSKQQALGSESENLDEQVTIAIKACASEENLHKMEEIDERAPSPVSSDDKPEEASEIHVCKEESTNDVTSPENMTICEHAEIVNPNSSAILNNKAASEILANGKEPSDTISEGYVVTDNGSGAGTLEASEIESDKGNVKPEAPFVDVNRLVEDDGISIDEHETPRLSNVSWTSNADSAVLAKENEQLRETVQRLLESEKDQLAVISTLNERLRNLEKQLKKKRNRKMKLLKSSNKNHEGYDQNIAICSM